MDEGRTLLMGAGSMKDGTWYTLGRDGSEGVGTVGGEMTRNAKPAVSRRGKTYGRSSSPTNARIARDVAIGWVLLK